MQFSAQNQKGLAVDDELGRTPALFEVWQGCAGVARLADGRGCKGQRE